MLNTPLRVSLHCLSLTPWLLIPLCDGLRLMVGLNCLLEHTLHMEPCVSLSSGLKEVHNFLVEDGYNWIGDAD